MNLVDSCAWLEYLADGSNADIFAPVIEDLDNLVVPTVCIFEVFKVILRERDEGTALQVASLMRRGEVVELDFETAIAAAKISRESGLPFADSVIYALACRAGAVVWTQDEHFEGLDGVRYFRKGGH